MIWPTKLNFWGLGNQCSKQFMRHSVKNFWMFVSVLLRSPISISIPLVVDWLGHFGVRKCYVRNRPGKFDLAHQDCFTLLRDACDLGSGLAAHGKLRALLWFGNVVNGLVTATEIDLVVSTDALPQCTHANDIRNKGYIGWKVALSRANCFH